MDDLVKRLRAPWNWFSESDAGHRGPNDAPEEAADRIEELEAQLEKAESVIAAAKEMYETAMLTGGGAPDAWVNHVKARNAFAKSLAELTGDKDE